MTDDEDTLPDDDPDTFNRDKTRKYGERGSSIINREQENTDLDSMTEEVEETVFSFCKCGSPDAYVDEIYRCCSCDEQCCSRCRVKIRQYNYCPNCVQAKYQIDKPAFKTMLMLDAGILSPDDLVNTDGADTDDEVITIEIDPAVESLLENGYIHAETPNPDDRNLVDADDALTEDGKEALNAGEELWGDDADIEELKHQIRVWQVTDQ